MLLESQYLQNSWIEPKVKAYLNDKDIIYGNNPIKLFIETVTNIKVNLQILKEEYLFHQTKMSFKSIFDKPLNRTDLIPSLQQRIQSFASDADFAINLPSLPTTYPEVLSWVKGKTLLKLIAGALSEKREILFEQLKIEFFKEPKEDLLDFLTSIEKEYRGID